jgi:hypothetical protein
MRATMCGRENHMAKFDLVTAIEKDPPTGPQREGVLKHPRMREWLRQLLLLRKKNGAVSYPYIARMLTEGGRVEGILESDQRVSVGMVKHAAAQERSS